MAKEKDRLFSGRNKCINDFDFGDKTAEVFDDMLERSIPLYRELQRMTGELANEFSLPGTNIYDLGCSTGITLQTLCSAVEKDVSFIGADFSEAMLRKAQENFQRSGVSRNCKFVQANLNDGFPIANASVVVMNLTLQFIRPLQRDLLIRRIASGLLENGCLILVEKVLGNDSLFNRMFIKFYYDLKKRNGYSDIEISQKREALENVLIPYRVDENSELLRKNGFRHIDTFFKWYNFCGILGVR